jgi:putative tricarboxylic transport membrane protein
MVLDSLVTGWQILFTPANLGLIAIAVVVGIVAGAIPGFTGTNTVAIALPFTLPMRPESAVIFMAAIYVGAEYGGAIPAALINTPGTAGATATVLDAYPMSKQGKAGQALGISILSSVIGGLVSAVVLLFLLNPLSQISYMFGQPEFFVLAIFGIAMLASIVGDDPVKGVISGLSGMIVAAMTVDPITGQRRLDFGISQLYSDVPFIPIIVGLFAISELFYLINEERISETKFDISSYQTIVGGFRQVVRRPWPVIRSTLIGMTIGTIPGAGTSLANFVSWARAKSSSSTPEKFGEGTPEGVIASEASNNAVTSGSLIPTLILGIPGSGTTAVILGALLLHGVRPGPGLMRDFGGEAMAIMLSLLFANVVLLVFAFGVSKYLVRVVLLPSKLIVPVVLVLTVVGAFALHNSMFDVWFMLLFGFLGYLMRETGYPIIPLVLGVILGPMAENGFRRSLELSQGDPAVLFTSSIITVVLWIATLVVFAGPPVVSRLRTRAGGA